MGSFSPSMPIKSRISPILSIGIGIFEVFADGKILGKCERVRYAVSPLAVFPTFLFNPKCFLILESYGHWDLKVPNKLLSQSFFNLCCFN